ncbi:MAG: hypothetical protein IJV66_01135 [Firmicutes bacterium]|nr:hypothetical protein [Bacillota bacterium]
MLSKLLKYELPAIGRRLIPLYLAWMVASALLGFALNSVASKSDFFSVISLLIYVMVTTAVVVVAIILVVQRYNNSILGDEAYFNMALPVTTNQHIANKTISALIWVVISTVAAFLSALIICIFGGATSEAYRGFVNDILPLVTGQNVILCIEFLIMAIVSMVKTVLSVYAAITVGHQASKHVWLAAIGAYIVFMVIEGTISWLCNLAELNVSWIYAANGFKDYQLLILVSTAILVALSAGYFLLCKYVIDKRLNLA